MRLGCGLIKRKLCCSWQPLGLRRVGKQAAAEGILESTRTDGTDLESSDDVDILADASV